jgi:hypothetical protein
VANEIGDVAINVDDIIKFDFQHSTSDQRESITVKVKLIHNCSNGKVFYYLDMSGLIIPTEDNAEYYLTGDRFFVTFELERWRFNVTKVYCEDNESVSYPFMMDISNLEIVAKN